MNLYLVQPFSLNEKTKLDYAKDYHQLQAESKACPITFELFLSTQQALGVQYVSHSAEVGYFATREEAERAVWINPDEMEDGGRYNWVLLSTIPTGTMRPWVQTEHLALYHYNDTKKQFQLYQPTSARFTKVLIETLKLETWQSVQLLKQLGR